ncbi:probable E3 ubiquitin-protein ligase ARI7 [Parambassis ranga]|uniref:Probable E3 ubiquitin-protein ligase ARI7 n=1 Tax=Parambassis ranga TaxID=210632 RepID=A0A6P7KCT1_9TELE|nr:probable E3 ubiquitin-protein ligase ARI7 [Parambassis ranga]
MGHKLSKRKKKSKVGKRRTPPFTHLENTTADGEKCYDPQDRTFTFVDGDDDLDFELEDFKSLRARMSCGHAVTPMSLTKWCRRLLDQGDSKFVCGQTDCDCEWSFEEVRKMALLTPEEIEYFEKKIFSNTKDRFDVKSCPGCNSSVLRTDVNNLCVECSVCTEDKHRTFMFCWQCLEEWKGSAPRSDRCENPGCINKTLATLKNCPIITFNDMAGVKDCPSIRACPTCGFLVEHSKAYCKGIVCDRCKVKFCFVCLRLYVDCSKSSLPYESCLTGTAPRQTSIPVWK